MGVAELLGVEGLFGDVQRMDKRQVSLILVQYLVHFCTKSVSHLNCSHSTKSLVLV